MRPFRTHSFSLSFAGGKENKKKNSGKPFWRGKRTLARVLITQSGMMKKVLEDTGRAGARERLKVFP